MYINNINNELIRSYQQLKLGNPTISIPKDGTEVILTDWYLIHQDPKIEYNRYTEKLEYSQAVFKDPFYTRGWIVAALTTEQIQFHIDSAKDSTTRQLWMYAKQLNLDSAEGIISGKGDIANRASKENSRISNIKLSSGALSSEEEQFFIAYSAMLEYQADVDIVAINTETEINNMNDATAIYAYDVATTPAWPAII